MKYIQILLISFLCGTCTLYSMDKNNFNYTIDSHSLQHDLAAVKLVKNNNHDVTVKFQYLPTEIIKHIYSFLPEKITDTDVYTVALENIEKIQQYLNNDLLIQESTFLAKIIQLLSMRFNKNPRSIIVNLQDKNITVTERDIEYIHKDIENTIRTLTPNKIKQRRKFLQNIYTLNNPKKVSSKLKRKLEF